MIDITVDWNIFELALIALAVALREWLHFTVCGKLGLMPGGRSIWLVPVRDALSFLVWGASFFGNRIAWKDMTFTVTPKGLMKDAKGYEA